MKNTLVILFTLISNITFSQVDTLDLDKSYNHGQSTVLLLNRKVLDNLEQHHKNALIVHGQFPEPAKLNLEKSYIHFFK